MIIENIGKYLEFTGVSVSAAEKQIGVSNGTLSKPIRQGTAIKTDTLEKFLNTFTDSIEWIFPNTHSNSENVKTVNEPSSVYQQRTDNLLEDQRIPLYNIEAAAGLIPLFERPNQNKTGEFIQIPRVPKCDGAVFVTGDSMYPLLKSGDIIAYKQINDFKTEIFWGEMYLISVEVAGEEYISVKWVQKADNNEYIRLVSENRNHQPKDVHLDKIRAMALVKASVRINSMG